MEDTGLVQDELLQLRVTLRNIQAKIKEASKERVEEKVAVYRDVIKTVLDEIDQDEKDQENGLENVWRAMQLLIKNDELRTMFQKLAPSQEEFATLLKSVQGQQETLKTLINCYESSDWGQLQAVFSKLIEAYDKNGYAKIPQMLYNAGKSELTNQIQQPNHEADEE